MLRVRANAVRLCDGISRRDMLHVGGLGMFGLSLAGLLQGGSAYASPRSDAHIVPSSGKAKSCILLFMMGGQPQHSTWDPKPDAPAEVRGDIKPIETNVPGIQYGELMPQLAGMADKLCRIAWRFHERQCSLIERLLHAHRPPARSHESRKRQSGRAQ